MAETKKLTQKDYFNMIIELATKNDREDIVDFCNERLEILSRKNASKGLTTTQKENIEIKENILALVTNENQSATDITKAYNKKFGTDFSTNKVSALLTQLKIDKAINRTEIKGKAYFTIKG